MGLRAWWTQRRKDRIAAYLQTYPDLTRTVLRDQPDLGLAAVQAAMDVQAASDPQRRTIEYPAMGQVLIGDRTGGVTGTLPKVTPFNLRRFSEYPPARRAINALTNPILDMPWTVELVPPVHGERNKAVVATADQQARINAAITMFKRPTLGDSWRVWLEQLIEDVCVGGYGCAEIGLTGDPQRPALLWPVDGQTVRINANWHGKPSEYHYAQSPSFAGLGGSYYNAVELRDDELLYFRLNPRTNTPFGLGYLEVAFNTVNAFMGAFDYATRRASNASPQYIIFLGENVDLAAARQWQHYWETMIEGRGKAPILGGGRAPTVQPLAAGGDDLLFLQWQEFLLRVIALSFGISPMKLGVERDVNRNTAEQQARSDWETSAPVAMTVADLLTHKLLGQILGWDDLQFRWLISESDQLRQAQILHEQYDMNAILPDEIREYYQRDPLADGWGLLTKDQLENKARLELGTPELPAMGDLGDDTGDETDDAA